MGVLIVEAKHRSGSGITARLAKEQGKKVFALPGRLDTVNGRGVNILIKNGAILASSPSDIIDEIPEFQQLKKKIVVKHNTSVKREYRKIYNVLSDIPVSLDEISIRTQNNIKCSLKLLSLMELDDLIEEIPGVRIC